MTALQRTVKSFTAAVLIACFAAAAHAAPDPGKYIEKLGESALAIISNKALNKAQKQNELEKIFSTNVDIGWVGKFVMGRHWRTASDDQKKLYLKKYEKFLTHHYSSRFADYTSGSFKVTGSREDGDGEFTVSMQIVGENPGDEPILVDYRIRKAGGGYKIFDVIVEGVSMITTQRSEFSSVITQHDIDYLIKNLSVISENSLPDKAAAK